jgi:hypothetical protein
MPEYRRKEFVAGSNIDPILRPFEDLFNDGRPLWDDLDVLTFSSFNQRGRRALMAVLPFARFPLL